MRAIRQHELGEAGTLRYEELDDPVPAAGQVRIRVEAAHCSARSPGRREPLSSARWARRRS
jgi:hypothetical protein